MGLKNVKAMLMINSSLLHVCLLTGMRLSGMQPRIPTTFPDGYGAFLSSLSFSSSSYQCK